MDQKIKKTCWLDGALIKIKMGIAICPSDWGTLMSYSQDLVALSEDKVNTDHRSAPWQAQQEASCTTLASAGGGAGSWGLRELLTRKLYVPYSLPWSSYNRTAGFQG